MSLSLLWELSSIKNYWVLSSWLRLLTTLEWSQIVWSEATWAWSCHHTSQLEAAGPSLTSLTSQWGSRASQGQSKHWQLKHSQTLTLGARNNQPVTSLSLRQIKIIKILTLSWQPSLGPASSPASGEVESQQLQSCRAAPLQERLWISNFTLCWDHILYILHSLLYHHRYTTLHYTSKINI